MRDEKAARNKLAEARLRAAAKKLEKKPEVPVAVAPPDATSNAGYARSRIVRAKPR